MATGVAELCEFLVSDQAQARLLAVSAVAELSSTPEGLDSLRPHAQDVSERLLSLVEPSPGAAAPAQALQMQVTAAKALVNLAQTSEAADALIPGKVLALALRASVDPRALKSGPCTEETIEPLWGAFSKVLQSLMVSLLANLTQADVGALALMEVHKQQASAVEARERVELPDLVQLIQFYCKGPPPRPSLAAADASTAKEDLARAADPFEHVGILIVNISRTPPGRDLIMSDSAAVFQQLLRLAAVKKQQEPSSRNVNALAAVRNSLFDVSAFLPEILLSASLLWPVLLVPLAGSKAYSRDELERMPKELAGPLSRPREPVQSTQLKCDAADAVLLLASQEGGKRALWSVNGPRILQLGYEEEEDLSVMEAYEKVGSVLVEGIEEETEA